MDDTLRLHAPMRWPVAGCGFGIFIVTDGFAAATGVLQILQNLPSWCARREQPQPPAATIEINYISKIIALTSAMRRERQKVVPPAAE